MLWLSAAACSSYPGSKAKLSPVLVARKRVHFYTLSRFGKRALAHSIAPSKSSYLILAVSEENHREENSDHPVRGSDALPIRASAIPDASPSRLGQSNAGVSQQRGEPFHTGGKLQTSQWLDKN